MTKLIIQTPCLNEESMLPVTLGALPRRVEGVGVVEWMINGLSRSPSALDRRVEARP